VPKEKDKDGRDKGGVVRQHSRPSASLLRPRAKRISFSFLFFFHFFFFRQLNTMSRPHTFTSIIGPTSDAGTEFLDKYFSFSKIHRNNSAATVPLKQAHNLIRKRLILPYLTGSFHPSCIEEYVGGLLMALKKQDGGLRRILCEEIWRRCFARLAVNATPVRNAAAKFFTSAYDNFIPAAGIRDAASHCAKILPVFYGNLDPTS
jgi:hypothetical protein